ncbi:MULTISPECIES: NAD-dependent epimerase/dehydratase family protein [Mycolicibacterium]|uniref:NAD-dependent epimerase/dehydratase n=1 Tax=Mycolicibacterium vanbaalenii (strain DSM 7251 / JCM 13017 / BCRC 16820 / KCTC 9966 / NRRL B-24157 / PYR-1) TaxID=350058 RepID=A1TCV4_MYCVP|nr:MULTISPECIES: NAD(P)-dependent oxidoreductase [Mycolicibacterium]ABM15004.1 NAD-dependent epimerase/dehydratase [Mycolicibacterium vanbaalenii PYR-1]MCV7129902.1 NAD(P)-dependent oxidoreductase [Mycolicibacterium vanbaalenii PYR-1]MDW5612425.1 NAD(P)-dependent oxidoreductase [Mycolicibacterium sp. D5.8-2]QZY44789.1 NAD(P)-dependent oxidoreductase [Mycolicibacterium austroafricanum]
MSGTSGTVLVTGGFGLVGSATVRRLVELGRSVVVADLDTPANRASAAQLPAGVTVRWTDLTDAEQTSALVSEVAPAVIIHLAAIIPPAIYKNRALARRVNVEATATLVRIAEAQPTPPRFVQASSNAVYGARNPYKSAGPVTADMPMKHSDLYSAHKAEAEAIVRASSLEWVVLRLGGVLSTDPNAIPFSADALYFESVLPADGRIHTVDVRDVAWAFAAATTADVAREILLIAGDDSHRVLQGDVGRALAESRGLKGGLVPGRNGDPNSDENWFVTDWMDTRRAQEALQFQHYSWQNMLDEAQRRAGASRYVLPVFAPLVRAVLKRRSAYWKQPGQYADPWGAIKRGIGDPSPDS